MNTLFKNINEIDSADIKEAVEVDLNANTVSDDESALNAEPAGNDIDVSKNTKQKKKQYNQAQKRPKFNIFTTVKQKTVYNH